MPSELIAAGKVKVSGTVAGKPATGVGSDAPIVVDTSEHEDPGYASRGAHKLIGALEAFPVVQVKGRRTLDAGASTGGFTDVLLRNGAARWSPSTSGTASWCGRCGPTSGSRCRTGPTSGR